MAGRRGVEVFTTFCESHTSQVPFHAVARLLCVATGVEGLDGQTARDRVRDRVPDGDPEDLLLLDDLLGIADPGPESAIALRPGVGTGAGMNSGTIIAGSGLIGLAAAVLTGALWDSPLAIARIVRPEPPSTAMRSESERGPGFAAACPSARVLPAPSPPGPRRRLFAVSTTAAAKAHRLRPPQTPWSQRQQDSSQRKMLWHYALGE